METTTSSSNGLSPESPAQGDMPVHLSVDGLVAKPQRLTLEDVAALPRTSCEGVLQCDHRADAGNQVWQGISLREIIQLAQPQPEARYVRVHAQDYCVPFDLTDIDEAVLVDVIDGQPLSKERGAPWRVFVPASQCHVNVKWVNRLELTATRGSTPEEQAARARQRARIPTEE
jgi:DMSO/TMAO reductase YedYZ molybdopterin-dependent catalytic subunit